MHTFNQCCERILADCKDAQAKAYASVGIGMTDQDAIRIQSLYILSNLSRWRSKDAKAVRASLKQYANPAMKG